MKTICASVALAFGLIVFGQAAAADTCTPVKGYLELCGLEADWREAPDRTADGWPTFRHESGLTGLARAVGTPGGAAPTDEEIQAIIGNESIIERRQALTILFEETRLAGQPARLIVKEAGGYVRAYTFATCGTAVIMISTIEYPTTLFHNSHRRAHEALAGATTVRNCK